MILLSQQEKDLLHFKNGFRKVTFRYDLLNYDGADLNRRLSLS